MKTLIEKSIVVRGIGRPATKTVFSIDNESEREDPLFKSLTAISGRTLSVWFKFTENGEEKSDRLQLTIIKSDSEQDIKAFILDQINNRLNS